MACVYLCVIAEDEKCAGVDYSNYCMLYIFMKQAPKHTVPERGYIKDLRYNHCVVDFCPAFKVMTPNKSCDSCHVNHYKIQQGSKCLPCELGYDANRINV